MKINMIGCVIILSVAMGQYAHAMVNADGTISATSQPPSVSTSSQTGRNPFSGGNSPVLPIPAEPKGVLSTPLQVTLLLNSGDLLSQGLQKWARDFGYKLLWQSKSDYLIFSPITLTGKNEDEVLTGLGDLFASENYGLIIKNYQKNRVLLVDDM
uniref:TcpQ domain-containing protein n=1 Tax=Rahnella sp. RFA10(1/100) TaxID=2511202 RepID=UPI001F107F55|nr:TcpQ domain-containing protein [Rahnella sp. RFA10(1/100)]